MSSIAEGYKSYANSADNVHFRRLPFTTNNEKSVRNDYSARKAGKNSVYICFLLTDGLSCERSPYYFRSGLRRITELLYNRQFQGESLCVKHKYHNFKLNLQGISVCSFWWFLEFHIWLRGTDTFQGR